MTIWSHSLALTGPTPGVDTPNTLAAVKRATDTDELLDGALDEKTLAGNLRDLSRVNRFLGGADLSWRALEPILGGLPRAEPLRVIDIGTGAADIPRALLRRAAAAGFALEITATDIRPEIVAYAQRMTDTPGLHVKLSSGDQLDLPDGSVDVAHASLVFHHLEPDQATRLLGEMARVASTAVIVNDLERARRWWVAAWLLSHLATGNRYTRNDAPLSVRRAYRAAELVGLAATAGLTERARYRDRLGHRYSLVLVPSATGIK